jgi:hypothetical protein
MRRRVRVAKRVAAAEAMMSMLRKRGLVLRGGDWSAQGEEGRKEKKEKRTKGTGDRSLARVSSVVDVMEVQNLGIHHLHSTKKKGKAPKGCQ